MATPGGYGSSSSSTTSSSFPTGDSIAGMTPAQFQAAYDISSTDMAMFTTNGALNSSAQAYVTYWNMTQQNRQALQEAMVQAGLLAQTDATGVLNSAANNAFQRVLGAAASQGQSVQAYLGVVGQGGLGATENVISSDVTGAQNLLDNAKVTTASLTPAQTDTDELENAFNQALGYSPSQGQINAFDTGIENQQTSAAEASAQGERTEAGDVLNQAKGEQAALTALGADGITAYVAAYHAAVNGLDVRGIGTTQGPPVRSTTQQPFAQVPHAWTMNGVSSAPGANPAIADRYAGQTQTQTRQVPEGGAAQLAQGLTQPGRDNSLLQSVWHDLTNPLNPALGSPAPPVPMTSQTTTSPVQIPGGSGHPSTVPVTQTVGGGGLYALSPKVWNLAKKAYPGASKYASAGSAPAAVQTAAFTALSQSLYEQTGSWQDVAITEAGGNPAWGNQQSVVPGAKESIEQMARVTAAAVNQQITNLQNQVNDTSPDVVTKVASPTSSDIDEEALNAAKQADPVGYIAANYASWGSELAKMIYGTPLTSMQSTEDTFTGPPGSTSTPATAPTQTQVATGTPAPVPAAAG